MSLEDLFKTKIHYAVKIDDGNGEKESFHAQWPYPHIALIVDLKSAKQLGIISHKISLNFSEKEYKAFRVKGIDNLHDVIDGLILFAAMRDKLGREVFDKAKYTVAEIIIERIRWEVQKLAGPNKLLFPTQH